MRRAAVLLPLLFASCATVRKVNIFSVPQEMAMGEVFSSEVETYYPVLRDPRVAWYINHRGRMLAELSDRKDLPYEFGVVDSPELNAFAIPGGHIYMNLGMIEAMDNEAELMGILAHEIGHVVARHSMKTLSQGSIVNIIGTIALNQYPNQWAALAANLFGTTGFLKMSRDAETEADALGYELMLRSGYDPEGMAAVFEKLLKLYSKQPNLLDKLFSTHPPTRERIDAIRAMIRNNPPPADSLRSTVAFQEVYDHILKEYYSEAGRRRWREVIEGKENPERKDQDRLPWDRKSDEERKKREEKEKQKREEKARDEERKQGGRPKDEQPEQPAEPPPDRPEPIEPPAGGPNGIARAGGER